MSVKVITESDTGLQGELAERFGILIVPHYINYKGQTYSDLDLDPEEFLEWLKGGEQITTSHPTVQDLKAAFQRAGEEAEALLYITISSRYSKVYDLAMAVKRGFAKPRIEVVDSGRAVGGHALLALEAARLAAEGAEPNEILNSIGDMQEQVDEVMVIDTLRQLAREGRARKAEEVMSSMISVKALAAHREGLVTPIGRARTNAQALDTIVKLIKQDLTRTGASGVRCLVEYGDLPGWVEQVLTRLREELSPQELWEVPAAPSTLLRIGPHGWSVAWCCLP